MTVAIKRLGGVSTKHHLQEKAKFYRPTIYINIITTIIVLKPSDTIELSRYHLCQVINKKVLLKVVDKFRCLLLGTLRIDIEY